ncbi:MAG: HAMP domain-containing sensor histidine kinase [Salinivirgaceae bacterium]|nr:HAMP domain-containing sensor histidine kinase [Salinivirgaceae bacterium]
MKKFIKYKPLGLEVLKIVGFGLLSLILSEMRFVVPGAVGGLSDMREIALIIGIFYFRHWTSVILLSLITSVGLHDGGSYLATFTMHAIGLFVIYFIYRFISRHINSRLYLLVLWIAVGCFYFYLLLIPIMGFLHYFLGLIEFSEYIPKYFELAKELRFEVIVTTAITSLYLLYLKTTERLEVKNKELSESIKKAEESEQLKTAFLQNLSHEIRTPLNGILGFSRLLRQLPCANEQAHNYTNHIMESGSQLLNIVNDVVDASHIDTGQTKLLFSKKPVISVFDDVLHALEPKGEDQIARIALNTNGYGNKIIESDPYKLVRINYHLIENALKFSKDKIQVKCEIIDNTLKISVEDKGIGIDRVNNDEIFKKFRQIDRVLTRDYGGNGLGLALVKGFVRELKGTVSFSSVLGEGTIFFVEIPIKVVDSAN